MDSNSQSPLMRVLIRYNSVLVLVISILVGTFLTYIAYDITGYYDIIFLLPIITFALMHYLRLGGMKRRLIAGLIIFLVVGIIAAGILSTTYYTHDHPVSTRLPNNATATISVHPFTGNGPDQYFNFSLLETNVPTGANVSATLNVYHNSSSSFTIDNGNLSHVQVNSSTVLLYKNMTGLPSGIYNYNFTIANGTSPIVLAYTGPINTGTGTLFAYLIPGFVFLFLVPMEIILLAIVVLARSMQRGSYFRNPPAPGSPGSRSAVDQQQDQIKRQKKK